jgi:hypothetical protein
MYVAVYGWTIAQFILYGSLFAGFVLESRRAAFIAVGGFAVLLTTHLVAGVTEYVKTMRRPWPDVPPIPDGDD